MLAQRIAKWEHVFKLDPNRPISREAIELICNSATDAVIVGGTDGVTFENTWNLLNELKRYDKFCVQEVSHEHAIVPGFDGYLIPVVLNAGDVRWIVRSHQKAIKKFGKWIPWENIAVEGYIVLNPTAKVAKLTQSETELSAEDVSAYAQLAEHMFCLPIVYIEYSGTYGDPQIVESAKKAIQKSILFYGGGIKSQKQAEEMARLADVVIVGNWLYEDLQSAIQSPEWVKQCKQKEGMRERG